MSSPLSGALRRSPLVLLAATAAPVVAAAPAHARAAATDVLAAPAAAANPPSHSLAVVHRKKVVRTEIRWLHRRTAHLSQTIRFAAVRKARLGGTLNALLRERLVWRRRYVPLRAIQERPPRQRFERWNAWMCIHRHEGAWNDPNAPYYGGLQMDLGFQRSYGAYLLRTKGTADNWTPVEQVAVAERAYKERGFSPWPNTAAACGLL
jgi:hypothetical protein